jgi:hypothetical protein
MRSLTVCVIILFCLLGLTGDQLDAVGIEQASHIYLSHSVALIRQAQRYAERSRDTYPLPGFDYAKFMQEVDTVGDGVETFLSPRPGDPVRVVPVDVDGHYISEELWRQGNALKEEVLGDGGDDGETGVEGP